MKAYVLQLIGENWYVARHRHNGMIPDHYFFSDLIVFLRLELSMKYTHLLELSVAEPRQYRITVVEEKPASMIAQVVAQGEGFNVVGWYDTPDALMEVLIPYLSMEQGK